MTINTCKSKQLVGVATTTWLTNTKYPYAKWHCIFFFLFRCFIPPSLPRFLSDLTVYMGNTAGVVWQAGNTYPGVTSRFWWGSFCSSFLVFFVVFFLFFVFFLFIVLFSLSSSIVSGLSIFSRSSLTYMNDFNKVMLPYYILSTMTARPAISNYVKSVSNWNITRRGGIGPWYWFNLATFYWNTCSQDRSNKLPCIVGRSIYMVCRWGLENVTTV